VLPFDAKSFDLVLGVSCVYQLNLPDAIKCLKEIQRVGRGKSFITLGAYEDESRHRRADAAPLLVHPRHDDSDEGRLARGHEARWVQRRLPLRHGEVPESGAGVKVTFGGWQSLGWVTRHNGIMVRKVWLIEIFGWKFRVMGRPY
jgi:hypothetical protein